MLDEIAITVTKPKLRKYFAPKAMEEMLLSFEDYIEIIAVKTTTDICRDTKDNFLLSLAKDGKADYLITGDKDLLELVKFGRTEIVTISKFLEEVKLKRS